MVRYRLPAGGWPLVLASVLLSACAGSVPASHSSSFETLAWPFTEVATCSRFTLTVLPESWLDGGTAQLSVLARPTADGVQVELLATQARGLKALYIDLDYDSSRLSPVDAEPAAAFGARGKVLHLAVLSDPGVVHYGQVLARPQDKAGYSGDGVLAAMYFRTGPAMPKAALKQAEQETKKFRLDWWNAGELAWFYGIWGDYDQNGIVNLADLTALARHLGESNSLGGVYEEFSYWSLQALIDGDSNGEINVADLQAIGANYGHSAAGGWNIYSSADANAYPSSQQYGDATSVALVQHLDFADSVVNMPEPPPGPNPRRQTHFDVSLPNTPIYFWVWTLDDAGDEWQVSARLSNWDFRPPLGKYQDELMEAYFLPEYGEGLLTWYYSNSGDCNQDGIVLMGDLTTLLTHWNESIFDSFDPYPIVAVADFDRNSEVNISDLTPFGWNLYREVAGYHIYVSDSAADYPPQSDSPSVIAPYADVPFALAIGDPAQEMLHFSYDFGFAPTWEYVWVRAYNSKAEEGAPLTIGTPWWNDF